MPFHRIWKTSLLKGYGVHTSLEITPHTWFRRLVGSLWKPFIAFANASRREEERRTQVRVADKQSLKLRDYAITSLRS